MLGLAPSKPLRAAVRICEEFLAGPTRKRLSLQMSEVIPFTPRSGDSEMITKLVNAGYLQPAQRNDPDAVSKAIARMKLDLRIGNGGDDPPAA
jgi:hypothetical protein